jgi:hypothetical protein
MNYLKEMKKVVLSLACILVGIICYGQNDDIDIKYLSSEEGKVWKRMNRGDGYKVAESLNDDLYIFYTDGTFKYDHSGTETPELSSGKTNKWSYDKQTNILSWEFRFPSGVVKKYSAELTYLSDNRVVMNSSEKGKIKIGEGESEDEKTHIVVFVTE